VVLYYSNLCYSRDLTEVAVFRAVTYRVIVKHALYALCLVAEVLRIGPDFYVTFKSNSSLLTLLFTLLF
jgi:hypothetical protein